MSVVEKVDGRLEALLERLERAIQELAAKPVVVHVHIPEKGVRGMGGCSKAKLLALCDHLLGVAKDAKKRNDWDMLLQELEAVREKIYYASVEEIMTELGL